MISMRFVYNNIQVITYCDSDLEAIGVNLIKFEKYFSYYDIIKSLVGFGVLTFSDDDIWVAGKRTGTTSLMEQFGEQILETEYFKFNSLDRYQNVDLIHRKISTSQDVYFKHFLSYIDRAKYLYWQYSGSLRWMYNDGVDQEFLNYKIDPITKLNWSIELSKIQNINSDK
jgi:hypothetical protein